MFDIMEFIKLLRKELDMTLYPMIFPASAPVECSVVTFSDILGSKLDVKNMEASFYCRADKVETALNNANKLIKRLDRETSLVFGDTQILLILAVTPQGKFMGTDENGNSVFLAKFKIVTCDK